MMSLTVIQRRVLAFMVLLVFPLGALRAQPTISLTYSSFSVELGQTAFFSGVRASGQTPLTYQWVEQGPSNTTVVLHDGATANGSTLSGTASVTLSISGTTAADAGSYAIEVTDANGYTTTSGWMSLVVKAAAGPTITRPPADVTVVAGYNATFSVAATGSYPRTYQWYKGTPSSGTAVTGATSSSYSIAGVKPADAGSYYVTIDNGYGTATSTAATLSVTPATPITFSGTGSSQTAHVGESVALYMYAYGSGPITYQWQKDGTPIAGATGNSYSISAAATTDAAAYTLVATNAAGSVTSPAITLTVNPAVPVTFSSSATPVTITVGQSLSLSMYTNGGSGPVTLQWQKDGAVISGATSTSYYKSSVTSADAGNYTLVATNPAGSTTSPAIVVTVNLPVAPSVTTPPADASVAQGNFVQFSVTVTGSTPMTYQWLKNGVAISGATSQTLYLYNVQPGDAASYSVTITNAASSVTSASAKLTVLPPIAPVFTGSATRVSVNQGSSQSLYAPTPYNSGVVGPYTYQWFKDGTAITGATSGSYLIPNAQASDAGTYVVNVTNAGGTVAAPATEVAVKPTPPSGTAWIDAAQQGSIVYFLFAQHIERYDLSSAGWLPSTSLSQTATAFCVAADGVYVGFGRALAKFPLDLSSQTTLANLGDSIVSMFSLGSRIYVDIGSYPASIYPVDRTTGSVGSALSLNVQGAASFVASPDGSTLYTPNSVWGPQFLTVDAAGKIGNAVNTSYYGTFPHATRAYLLPDQQHVADNGGTIFNLSDGKIAATFGGAFTDAAFLADGTPVILRDNLLYTYAVGGVKETAHAALTVVGSRVFVSGGNVFVFYPGASSGNSYVNLTEVPAASISSDYPAAAVVDASTLSFTPSATIQDKSGTVYGCDAAHENLVRWVPASHAYATSIPLSGAPTAILYSATLNRIFCVYQSGRITWIDPGAASPVEQSFAALPDAVITATAADNFIYAIVQDAQDSGEEQVLIDGRTGAITAFQGWGYFASSYTWSSANQSLYPSQASYSSDDTIRPVSSTGTLPAPTVHFSQTHTGAVFPSPDGTRLVAAGGQVYDATGLYLGSLGNAVTAVSFLGALPFTIRADTTGGTEVQVWSATNFVLSASAALPGTPIALYALGSDQLLAVTESGGAPAYTILNRSLQRVSTTATSDPATGAPSYISQPAASESVYSGTDVTLAVDTSGATPQTFQWYRNGTAVAGATTSTLTLSTVTTADAANYYVIATNSAGSATSTTTTLSVFPALTFTRQPQSQTAASGATVTFTASAANATGASYQWYFNGAAVAGATSDTLVISPVNTYSNYGTYVLKVSNTAGAIYSTPATLAAPPTPAPSITVQPQSATVQPGGAVTLTVSGNNVNVYQWYFNGSAISGATSSYLTLSNATSANTGIYTVVLTGPGGTTTSNAAVVTVQYAPPSITAQPTSYVAVVGNSASFSVSGQNVTSFQWYFQGSAIVGATSGIYAIPVVASANVGSYYVVLTGPGGTATSNTVTLTLQATAAPVITAQPQSATVAAGGSVSLSVAASNATAYQWYRNNSAITGATSATLPFGNFTSADAGSYTVVVSGPGGAVTSNAAVLSLQTSSFAGSYFGTINGGGHWAMSVPASGNADFIAYLPQNAGAIVAELAVDAGGTFSVSTLAAYSNSSSGVVNPGRIFGQIASGVVNGTIDNGGGAITGSIDSGNAYSTLAGYYTSLGLNGETGQSYVVVGGSGQTFAIWVNIGGLGTQPDSVSGMLSGDPEFSGTTAQGRSVTLTIDDGSGALSEQLVEGNNPAVVFSGLPATTPNTARLLNLSARADVGVAGDALIAGFAVSGNEDILVRGVGPALKNFGVDDVLAAPKLTFNDGAGKALWTGTNWGGSQSLSTLFTSVGAFPLDATSADAAHSFAATNSGYTAIVSGADDGTGIALAEVYGTDGRTSGGRLVNLSARASVHAGDGVLTAGLVIGGTGPETVLLRGVGPALKSFGVTDYLASPQLTLRDADGKAIAVNIGWSDSGLTTNWMMSQVGAFELTPGSADCVIRATLMPGNYTVQVTSRDTTNGVALVEVYEVK